MSNQIKIVLVVGALLIAGAVVYLLMGESEVAEERGVRGVNVESTDE